MKKETSVIIMLLFIQLCVVQSLCAQTIPAFPGAEGAGANASGGRDGDLYFVTNVNDSGPGSFRYGVDNSPPEGRAILFKVSGIMNLETGMTIKKENITIAGQTAPGDGIRVAGRTIYIGDRAPLDVPPIITDSPGDAYLKIIALGGATPWRRDPLDKRVIGTIINQNGKIIDVVSVVGGYLPYESEEPPEDSDNDGMPDFSGLANFTYSAVEPRDGFGFGLISVGVLILGQGVPPTDF